MADIGWARSRGDRAEGQGLRRGAWYRVVENPPKDFVVLDVHHVEIRIPKGDVEIRAERPNAWSVVREPHLVCPGCHDRAVIPERYRPFVGIWSDAAWTPQLCAALIVEIKYQPPFWAHAALWLPLILATTLLPLRSMKALLIALQFHHKAAEGRLIGREPK